METHETPLTQLAAAIAAIPDPAERAQSAGSTLGALPELQTTLRQIRQVAVQELRDEGASHADVAKILGVSRARAAQIAEGKTSRAAPTPTE